MTTAFRSVKGLARHLGWKLTDLESIAGKAAHSYRPFDRRRVAGRGSWRHIDRPTPPLLDLQRCIHRRLLCDLPLPPTIYGVRGRSINDNAGVHVGKETVACLDLYHCYPEISDLDVFDAWTNNLGFGHDAASLLTKLTTRHHRLPQGAPTSPMLSIVVLSEMYDEIERLVVEMGVDVTFYADDITLSGDSADRALSGVVGIIHAYGRRVSRDKIRVMRRNRDEQRVTGVVTNEGLSAGADRLRSIRDEILELAQEPDVLERNLQRVRARIEQVKGINASEAEPLSRLADRLLPGSGVDGTRPRSDEVQRCARSRSCRARQQSR